MRDVGRLLLIAGLVLVVAGIVFMTLPRFGLGRLPGDFVYRRGSFTLYVPLMTSILLSIALTVILWLFRR
jgi:DUF2905 family protein